MVIPTIFVLILTRCGNLVFAVCFRERKWVFTPAIFPSHLPGRRKLRKATPKNKQINPKTNKPQNWIRNIFIAHAHTASISYFKTATTKEAIFPSHRQGKQTNKQTNPKTKNPKTNKLRKQSKKQYFHCTCTHAATFTSCLKIILQLFYAKRWFLTNSLFWNCFLVVASFEDIWLLG